jgi:hypothetical protein
MMKKATRSYSKKNFTKYYRELGLRPKTVWIHKDTIIKLGTWAAKESFTRHKRISFNTFINEILDAKARELPEE